jgi:hypothetical protein
LASRVELTDKSVEPWCAICLLEAIRSAAAPTEASVQRRPLVGATAKYARRNAKLSQAAAIDY